MIAPGPLDILRSALDWTRQGRRVVLVTLVQVEGTSARLPGTQMAVTDDGKYIGSFSGGCIEGAIITEAQDCLASGSGRTTRYGAGSPYFDVRLPCGGGIDLLFTPHPDPDVIARAIALLSTRSSATLAINERRMALGRNNNTPCFEVTLIPPLRILAFGHGDNLTAFVRLASYYGAVVEALSADQNAPSDLAEIQATVARLDSRQSLPSVNSDAWTAIVFLFHDHDWEEFLLPYALTLPAFYHGAIGSARTHQLRLEGLRRSRLDETRIAALHGRIGLIPSTRDPAMLALSVLGEVAAAYRDALPDQQVTWMAANNSSHG